MTAPRTYRIEQSGRCAQFEPGRNWPQLRSLAVAKSHLLDEEGRDAGVLPAHDGHDELEHPVRREIHDAGADGPAERDLAARELAVRVGHARERRPVEQVDPRLALAQRLLDAGRRDRAEAHRVAARRLQAEEQVDRVEAAPHGAVVGVAAHHERVAVHHLQDLQVHAHLGREHHAPHEVQVGEGAPRLLHEPLAVLVLEQLAKAEDHLGLVIVQTPAVAPAEELRARRDEVLARFEARDDVVRVSHDGEARLGGQRLEASRPVPGTSPGRAAARAAPCGAVSAPCAARRL
ncbi:hypothetical protein ON010_g11543 [Phytophthora cinnamomi]|nr:hypothetical protein ON010_g11543 [Phytophthora cinnamomi]